MSTEIVKEPAPKSGMRTRLMAFAALAAFVAGATYAGRQVYLAATDSFVAPAILSPDSDMVIASKVKMAELYVERGRVIAEIEAVDADVAAAQEAVERLERLRSTAGDGLAWTKNATGRQMNAASMDLKTLARQQAVLAQMLEQQQVFTADAHAAADPRPAHRGDVCAAVATSDGERAGHAGESDA
jgi:hypothetical protein